MLFSVLIVLLVILLFIVAFVLVRALAFARPFEPVEQVEGLEIEAPVVAEHLSNAIRCETVSQLERNQPNRKALLEMHRSLEKMYPRLHTSLKWETVKDYSLLYTWQGQEPEQPAVLLAGHLDVVPADPASLKEWTHPPFSGTVADGFVWGRGALDIKEQVITMMEAVEQLLKSGYQPGRTIYLAFGHDEENGGISGAKEISALLASRGVQLDAVIDEGSFILENILPGVKVPIAAIGMAEKGMLTLKLKVEAEAGHSSTPPDRTAIGILAEAILNLEENPLPARTRFAQKLFKGVGIASPFFYQMAFANLWLFGGLIKRQMSKSPQTNAIIRTTTATTAVAGGIKENILPTQAKALVNFRLLPGTSIADVCTHATKVIGDKRVSFQPVEDGAWEATSLSPTSAAAYTALEKTVRQIFGNLPVAPFLVLGATDSRHYAGLCENIYRFTPVAIDSDSLRGVHGVNERVSVEALGKMVKFYGQLIQNWGASGQ
ncbi:MAG: M20 family peptidase [Anaerolineaceae bacterium]|nr:M20 family peptidase [Anaerolineaceae bacterium]